MKSAVGDLLDRVARDDPADREYLMRRWLKRERQHYAKIHRKSAAPKIHALQAALANRLREP